MVGFHWFFGLLVFCGLCFCLLVCGFFLPPVERYHTALIQYWLHWEDARQLLWPVQVGVAVPNGAEIAIHTVRAWSRRHTGSSTKVLLKLDFSNAFNSVSRAVVLEEVRAHFPQLARWATWCYGQPSRLQFGRYHEANRSPTAITKTMQSKNELTTTTQIN